MPCTERPVLSADCSALNTCRPAPNSDCSAFVALRFAPFADCSVIRIAPLHDSLRARHLAPRAAPVSLRVSDCSAPRLAPRSTLAAPYPFGLLRVTACAVLDTLRPLRSRIAPRSTLAPCTDHGLLRAQRFDLRTVQGLLPARHLTLRTFSDCSASRLAPRLVPHAPAPFPSRSVIRIAPLHVSLRARRLAFRAEPVSPRVSDCSAPRLAPRSSLPALCCSRIAPLSTLRVPHRARIAPCSTLDARCQDTDCSVFDTFRFAPYSDCSESWVSPLHGLHRARYLAFLAVLGLLLARHLAPCIEPGLLRAQHLVLPAGAIR